MISVKVIASAHLRGEKLVFRKGETFGIPSNAPHHFKKVSAQAARLLCICALPDRRSFFAEVGTGVATRTTPPPILKAAAQAEMKKKALELAPKYHLEL